MTTDQKLTPSTPATPPPVTATAIGGAPAATPAGGTPPPAPAGGTPTPAATPAGGTPTPGATPGTPTPAAGAAAAGDWRTAMAGDSPTKDKDLALLARYATADKFFEAHKALLHKMSTGELKGALPENATPEEKTAWRAANGIPETPDKYDLSGLPNGLTIGDADKPQVDAFLKSMHDQNAPPGVVKAAIGQYFTMRDEGAKQLQAADQASKVAAEDALRSTWGQDYHKNKQVVENLLSTLPSDVAGDLIGGRMADGSPIFNNVKVLNWFADQALKINPASKVLPNTGSDPVEGIKAEIQKNVERMGKDPVGWSKDMTAQARHRELIDLDLKMAPKKAG